MFGCFVVSQNLKIGRPEGRVRDQIQCMREVRTTINGRDHGWKHEKYLGQNLGGYLEDFMDIVDSFKYDF